MKSIYIRLRDIRRQKNMSQEELAKRLGISRQAIIAIEQGASLPSLPVIIAILRELDIPFDHLLRQWSPFRSNEVTESDDTSRLAVYRDNDFGRQIPVQLLESQGEFVVTAELAGVKEEDLTVDMSTQHVLIMATKRNALNYAQNNCFHIQEIFYGPVMRIVSLPSPIDTTQASAEFSRGVLELRLPKYIPESKRRITFKNNDTLEKPTMNTQSNNDTDKNDDYSPNNK